MEITIRPSRSGAPTCEASGVWLHSRYEPEKEALRFAVSELASSTPSHVVLLGPCLDYLSSAVRTLLPGARIVSVQYARYFAESGIGNPDSSWYPDSDPPLEAFLDAALDEDAISGVAVLEWEPAARVFPAQAASARAAIKESLDRLASSIATVKSAGRRWITNACASFLLLEQVRTIRPTSLPILVAAAGPSLARSLRGLSGLQGRFATIAVSSALSACRFAGIEPDIVIATDGGFWSRLHLYPLSARPLPLAAPLTALPSSSIYRGNGIVLLDQGSFAESELLPLLGPSIAIPPHGTVSGSALQLASRIGSGPIFVAGLDLASFDGFDHARPHGFDGFYSFESSRLEPLDGGSWSRLLESTPIALPQRPWRSSRSLFAYASALSLDSARLAGRLFRLEPSPIPLNGFEDIDCERARLIIREAQYGSAPLVLDEERIPDRDIRTRLLASRIGSWRELAREATSGMGRGYLSSSGLVNELLRSIDIVDYAAARRAILGGGDGLVAARDLASRCENFLSTLARRFAA